MNKIFTLLLILFGCTLATSAQNNATYITDGFDFLMTRAKNNNPTYDVDVAKLNAELREKSKLTTTGNSAAKTTAASAIPVIFHIVLTETQLQQIGGAAGVKERVLSQLDVLNADFNAANADSGTIPVPFKPLYGNAHIRFELAHKGPDNNYTPGYEIITTTKGGFNVQSGTMGSQSACSDVKFKSSGGADQWDPKKYLNIWITNITPAGVGGVGTPPPYPAYGGTALFPWNEQGVVINYNGFGKQTNSSQSFPWAAAKAGRTLVHELGHFFNLFHPFGISTFNNTNCTDDDGVNDTPKESVPTQSTCPSFPLLDICSPSSPGVMFMNHMDYSADSCRTMFTLEQVARMNVELAPGGYRDSLLYHPDLIYYWPQSITNINNDVTVQVYPNPASQYCYVETDNVNIRAKEILLVNNLGQIIQRLIPETRSIAIPLSGLPSGVYHIKCVFEQSVTTKQLIINQ